MFEQLHKRIIEFDSAVDYDFSIDNNPSRLISVGESYEKYNFHLDFIFNVSLQIFHTCTYYIMEDLGEPVNSELVVKINERMFLIGIPFKEFSEEICLQIQTRKISISTLSLFGRQIVEQIVLVSELRKQKIPYENVFIASVASHNKHVGSTEIELNESMNNKNSGLFKAFKQRMRPENLVKNYDMKFIYNLFSGNIHSPSTISSYLFKGLNSYSEDRNQDEYTLIFLKMYLDLLVNTLEFVISQSNNGKFSDTDVILLNEIREITKNERISILDSK
ncbi:hypothetical protein [Erysipelothrix rhusiopathiae]|uniref:hypothetical protein n=1 Tax=Erysipelothrix rhusiopathiae TaxID=1648 RepID=UPI0024802110|nr:hypothetical protein [Erysipelothrix rhusiopathiae]